MLHAFILEGWWVNERERVFSGQSIIIQPTDGSVTLISDGQKHARGVLQKHCKRTSTFDSFFMESQNFMTHACMHDSKREREMRMSSKLVIS